jgi:hypothetical protein
MNARRLIDAIGPSFGPEYYGYSRASDRRTGVRTASLFTNG